MTDNPNPPNNKDSNIEPVDHSKVYTDMRRDGQSMSTDWLEGEIYELGFAISQREEYSRLDQQLIDRYKQIIAQRAKKAAKAKKQE